MKIGDYAIVEKLYESHTSRVYRGRNKEGISVILKTPNESMMNPAVEKQFFKEYELLTELDSIRIVKPIGLEIANNRPLLILEDNHSVSLHQYMKDNSMDEASILKVAIQLAEALIVIHRHNIIHKDINPSNIILSKDGSNVKIIDFCIATRLSKELGHEIQPYYIEGVAHYISPEQTGRMNRSVDYRTDFYSFGITLYELLTGQPLFPAIDIIGTIHSQIAQTVLPPHIIHPKIPKILSSIVMKCLSKMAEERYQSAEGLRVDLVKCLHYLENNGEIPMFALAQQDVAEQFIMPETIFGRTNELQLLAGAFTRVCAGPSEMILISGPAGIGKTRLVLELQKQLRSQDGFIISGKFDQYKTGSPYSPLIAAFQDVIERLLAKDDTTVQKWREDILEAVGSNGQILLDVLPKLKWLIGEQPEVQTLPPKEAQNRFRYVIENFIRVFGQKDHPLILFLDDLHWGDASTFQLLAPFMNNSSLMHMLIIGAVRDQEDLSNPALHDFIRGLQSHPNRYSEIHLQQLDESAICDMLECTLNSPRVNLKPLAAILNEKTKGNPFFIQQFLQDLYENKWLYFDDIAKQWKWQLNSIQNLQMTENVIDLLVVKLKKKSDEHQYVLAASACLGHRFDLMQLAYITKISREKLIEIIEDSIQHAFVQWTIDIDSEVIMFTHDRIQQAAYHLLTEKERSMIHYQIATRIYVGRGAEQDDVFEKVNHFNLARDIIDDPEEKLEIARLNMEAGRKAKKISAFDIALQYFQQGIGYMTEEHWRTAYPISYGIWIGKAETEYLCNLFNKSDMSLNYILENANSPLDKSNVYDIRINMLTWLTQYDHIGPLSSEILLMLGFPLSHQSTKIMVMAEMMKLKRIMRNKTVDQLLNLPPMTDEIQRVAVKIMNNIGPAAYYKNANWFALSILHILSMSLHYGNAPDSCMGYSSYGVALAAKFGDIRQGFEFGKLGWELAEKNNDTFAKCRTYGAFGVFINHWLHHARSNLDYLHRAYQCGLESGNLLYASYSANAILDVMVFCGFHLEEVLNELRKYTDISQRFNFESLGRFYILHQFIRALSGDHQSIHFFENDLSNKGENPFDTPDAPSQNRELNRYLYYLYQAEYLYLFGKTKESFAIITKLEPMIDLVMGQIVYTEHLFYSSLIHSDLYDRMGSSDQKKMMRKLKKNLQQFKIWSHDCPDNFIHAYWLIHAEIARISGQEMKAIAYYDKSIQAALENQFNHHAAMANERMAQLYLNKNNKSLAKYYLTEAYKGYMRWGALGKATQMNRKYDAEMDNLLTTAITNPVSTTNGTLSQMADLHTVMKATQTISSEIKIERFLSKMMEITLENAGAHKGYFIMENAGEWFIEAEGHFHEQSTVVKLSQRIEEAEDFPFTIIQYVIRIGESLILHDAFQDDKFANDAYVLAHQLKSVICLPIKRHGEITAVIYLENNLLTHAFNAERLELLNLLSLQASISLENARLYKNLDDKVWERTQSLEEALHTIKHTQNQLVQAEKMAALGSLVAGIAHEINTPLGIGITASSHLFNSTQEISTLYHQRLIKKQDMDEYLSLCLESATMILSNLKRAAQLISSFKRIAVDQSTEEKRTFMFKSYLEEILISLTPELKKTRHIIHIHCQQELKIRSYPGFIAQIITNLVMNSIIHAFDEDMEGQIDIEINSYKNELHVTYKDNGKGIEPEYLSKIFDPFFTTNRKNGSTGLGLHLVYNIVTQKLSGTISCESVLRKGTSFSISIPVE